MPEVVQLGVTVTPGLHTFNSFTVVADVCRTAGCESHCAFMCGDPGVRSALSSSALRNPKKRPTPMNLRIEINKGGPGGKIATATRYPAFLWQSFGRCLFAALLVRAGPGTACLN